MALIKKDRAAAKPNREALNNLRMNNFSPEFDDDRAYQYWVANLTDFERQANQTLDRLKIAKPRS